MIAPLRGAKMGTAQPDFDAEKFVPELPFVRVTQIAELLTVTNNHILSLIKERVIKVPKKLQASAPSGPAMRVPRKSVVDFVRRRSSSNIMRERKQTASQSAKTKAARGLTTRPTRDDNGS